MKNRKREITTSGSVRSEDGQPPHLLGRRQFLHLAAGAAALPAVTRIARAQAYPSRPVRIMVGFAAGSTSDIYARLVGQWLSERLAQPFVVENRPGAGSNIGTAAVVNAPPDGYTLLMIASANAIIATLYERLNFDGEAAEPGIEDENGRCHGGRWYEKNRATLRPHHQVVNSPGRPMITDLSTPPRPVQSSASPLPIRQPAVAFPLAHHMPFEHPWAAEGVPIVSRAKLRWHFVMAPIFCFHRLRGRANHLRRGGA